MSSPNADMPLVIIAVNTFLHGWRSSCRAFLDYARTHGPWRCLLMEGRDCEQQINLKRLKVSGIKAHTLSREDAMFIASRKIPVVLGEPLPEMLESGQPLADAPYVKLNSYKIGVMAANYYLSRSYGSFAYIGETLGMYWSADRRRGFEDTLKEAGFGCAVYGKFSKRERHNWNSERPRMIRFLSKLPKRTAVFAAMDGRARLVLDACIEATQSCYTRMNG